MKSEWRIFALVATFFFVMCGLYAWWSADYADNQVDAAHHVEWIGVIALFLSGMLCLMCGGYFWFVSTHIDPRPEDRADAEIADGAGEVGFFSPGSYWPFGVALCCVFAAFGIAVWQPWMITVGVIAIILATSAMLFEYYSGARRAQH